MIILTTLSANTIEDLNLKKETFLEVTKCKRIISARVSTPIEGEGKCVMPIYYDDGRENKRWTTSGDSLKKGKGKLL